MKDMMMEVYNRLIDNPLIREKTSFINDNGKTEYRIKFYEVPETLDTTKPSLSLITFLVHKLTLILPTTKLYQFGLIIKLTLKAWIE